MSEERHLLERILDILERAFAVTDFQLFQRKGDFVMAITGVQAGATGTFQISLVPPNGVPLSAVPTVVTDDALVTLSTVGANLQFTAAVAATDTAASFNVRVSGVNGAG